MLVLRRKLQEKILIGNSVEVMVLEIGKSFVRLGITAPKDIRVDRSEVRERIDAEDHQADAS